MKHNFRGTALLVAVCSLLFAGSALAQHSDVEISVEGSQLVIENGLLTTDGGHLFESEFGELGNPFGTEDPGFEVDDGQFAAGEILAFEALGSLQQWDGSSWVSASDAVQIVATDVLGMNSVWDSSGVTNPIGLIDAADSEGGIHSHIDFGIEAVGGGSLANGAYLVELLLFGVASDQTTPVYDASSSMYIAFNFGLSEEDFETAVDALLAPVPIPGAAVLMLSGLLSFFGLRRRNLE